MINCKTGNLELETQGDDLEQDPIEESKTLPKNLNDASPIQKSPLSQTNLSGFIEKDAAIGKIEVDGFYLSIKGLSTEHEQRIDFKLSEWRLVLSLIKYYNEPLKVMIGNYKSSQEELISK